MMKNKLIHSLIFILSIIYCSSIYSQSLNILYNNSEDEKLYKTELESYLNPLIEKFNTVITNHPEYNPDEITIDIIFLDSKNVTGLKFSSNNQHWLSLNFVDKWKLINAENQKILFYFTKTGDSYVLDKFMVTESLTKTQLPDIVVEYINDQIAIPNKNDYKKCSKDCINALKNAFDLQFRDKLVDMGQKMIEFQYYYKGYTYISTPYAYFEYIESTGNKNLNKELEISISSGLQVHHYDIYLKDWPSIKANVFDVDFGHSLIFKTDDYTNPVSSLEKVYVKTDATGIEIFRYYSFHFSIEEMFNLENCTYSDFKNIPTDKEFSFIKDLKSSKKIIEMKIDETDTKNRIKMITSENPVNYKSTYKLFNNFLTGASRNNLWTEQEVSPVTNKIGWGVSYWRNFRENKPTWCNVFACDLSNHIYGKVNNDYPVPYGTGGKTANQLNKIFKEDSINYKEISNEKQKIWEKYIDKGYPVYFSGTGDIGHIETGFPSGTSFGKKNSKVYEERKTVTSVLNSDSKCLSVGAGGYVGYKSYAEYSFLQECDAFLYLGYLKKEY